MECAVKIQSFSVNEIFQATAQAGSIVRGGIGSIQGNAKCLLQDVLVIVAGGLQFVPDPQPLIGAAASGSAITFDQAGDILDALKAELKPHAEAEVAGIKADAAVVGAFNWQNFLKNALALLKLIAPLIPLA